MDILTQSTRHIRGAGDCCKVPQAVPSVSSDRKIYRRAPCKATTEVPREPHAQKLRHAYADRK